MVVFEFGFNICAGNTYVIVMIFCHLILCGNSLTGITTIAKRVYFNNMKSASIFLARLEVEE
jgi:hypothetical protein